MTTIKISDNSAANSTDRRDALYPPSKTFKRTIVRNADGLHAYSQLADGKTVTHTFLPMAEIEAFFEKHEPNFARPKPVDTIPKP